MGYLSLEAEKCYRMSLVIFFPSSRKNFIYNYILRIIKLNFIIISKIFKLYYVLQIIIHKNLFIYIKIKGFFMKVYRISKINWKNCQLKNYKKRFKAHHCDHLKLLTTWAGKCTYLVSLPSPTDFISLYYWLKSQFKW